jgi:ubiquinone/menaquinone biosynthesis C-methylase UbiE
MFRTRSCKLERIDTGDYTPEEYERFLREISFINRVLGDNRALKKTLLRQIESENLESFSVLDIGAGSGELLRTIADFARKKNREAKLFGLELNARSARAIKEESRNYSEINSVRADAFELPFADNACDYAICSLFTHHFTNENVVKILAEMRRVARRRIYIIDLHRHAAAYVSYKIFCAAFRISPLVREDGLLSILRSFKPQELQELGEKAGLKSVSVKRIAPFRLVLEGN